MEVMRVVKIGGLMSTLEELHICKETNLDHQINDKCTAKPNALFDTIIQNSTDRGHLSS